MPTLIFEDKFETGGTWDTSNGTPVIVSSPAPPSSTKALECNAIGDYVFWNIPDSGFTRCVWGVWVRTPAFPATSSHLFKLDAGPCEGWCDFLNSSGRLRIVGNGTPSIPGVNDGSDLVVDTWYWIQVMFDVSANPWELRFNRGGNVISSTGAQTATNLNPGNFLLGNTAGGSAATYYFGHAKAGVAANDDDWWAEPAGPQPADDAPLSRLGRGAGW